MYAPNLIWKITNDNSAVIVVHYYGNNWRNISSVYYFGGWNDFHFGRNRQIRLKIFV
jgi:hypothetical protein